MGADWAWPAAGCACLQARVDAALAAKEKETGVRRLQWASASNPAEAKLEFMLADDVDEAEEEVLQWVTAKDSEGKPFLISRNAEGELVTKPMPTPETQVRRHARTQPQPAPRTPHSVVLFCGTGQKQSHSCDLFVGASRSSYICNRLPEAHTMGPHSSFGLQMESCFCEVGSFRWTICHSAVLYP